MDRIQELRKYVCKEKFGIEIAPYFNPIVRKSDGYNILIVDVFDENRLRENAKKDPHIADYLVSSIEQVDIVSDASRFAEHLKRKNLDGKVHYVLSSHNFEHLPDPIRFLRGCSSALAEDGVLSMAIPDGRACFDHFRMPTRLVDWLAAYHRNAKMPTAEMLFDFSVNTSFYNSNKEEKPACHLEYDNPKYFKVKRNHIKDAYAQYISDVSEQQDYRDAHCSVLFGEVFELHINDLCHLGLLDLDVIEITPTRGFEFFVHLRKSQQKVHNNPADEQLFYDRREQLLRSISLQLGVAGFGAHGPRRMGEYARRIQGSKHNSAFAYIDPLMTSEATAIDPPHDGIKQAAAESSVVVVIPFYNGSATIGRAVQSVLNQTVSSNEFIIVDDGSTVEEAAQLDDLAATLGVRVIHQVNGGQGSARNTGVEASNSEFICFLDQDDYFLPDHIEALLAKVPKNDKLFGWVYGDLIEAQANGCVVQTGMVRQHSKQHPKKDIFNLLQEDMFVLPSASLISRQAFEAVGGFDQQFTGYEDDDLFLRIFRAGYSNYFTPKAVTVWCINPQSTSYSIRMARSRLRYLKKLVAMFPDDFTRRRFYVRDCIIPRFHKQILGEAIAAASGKGGKFRAYRNEYIGIANEYARVFLSQKRVSIWKKVKLRAQLFMLNSIIGQSVYKIRKRLGVKVKVVDI